MGKTVIGIDFGTLSARAALYDTEDGRELASSVCEYPHGVIDDSGCLGKRKPEKGTALQDPDDYLFALKTTVPALLEKSGIRKEDVCGIGFDFTSCTLLPVRRDGTPLCREEKYKEEPNAYVKLWKHHTAQKYADLMTEKAEGAGWLASYGGKVSSEWFFPKVMETLCEAEEVYRETDFFMEAGDWLVMCLCGKALGNTCMAGFKAFYDTGAGFVPDEYLARCDKRLSGIIGTKVIDKILPSGELAGRMTKEGAELTGLAEGTAVASPVIDAHAAFPALGITEKGAMLLIVGTSGCHLCLDDRERKIPGICGYVRDGVIKGKTVYEAGQSAVGDIFDWFVKNCVPKSYAQECERTGIPVHKLLREKAEKPGVGESGLIALDWWNGNRSVLADSGLSGLIVGLTLSTKPEEIYRALLEACAYGTRVIVDTFRSGGTDISEIYAAGGIAGKDSLMMQIYADVLGMPIRVAEGNVSSALGSAVLAACACGLYPDVKKAAEHMVRQNYKTYTPIPGNSEKYEKLFRIYKRLHDFFGVGEREIMAELKK